MGMFRTAIIAATGVVAIAGASAVAAAETTAWPDRAITLVVPFAAGGGGDTLARLVSNQLAAELKQTIVVENKPGAGGNIGTSLVAHSKADGYTLAYGTNGTQAMNYWLYKSVDHKPSDFSAISRFTTIAAAVTVNASAPYKNLQDLIDDARKNPGKLTCGSAGNGTTSHMACEQLKQMTGINMVHVPYRGGAAALVDLIGGRITVLMDVMPNVSPQIKTGKVKALAVTSAQRLESDPDIPTIAESGVPGYEFMAWDGIFAPAGTSPAILSKINAAVARALADPALSKTLKSKGATPAPLSIADTKKFVNAEYTRLGDVVKKAGASVD